MCVLNVNRFSRINTLETDIRAADVAVISNGHLGDLTVTGEAKGDVKDIKADDFVIYARDFEKELVQGTDYVLHDGGVEFLPAYTNTFAEERTVTINIGFRYYYVTVKGAVYNINTSETSNGKVNVSKTTANPGETVTVTTEPDEYFTVHRVTVLDKEGKEIDVRKTGDNSFEFIMPDSDVTVGATFADSGKRPAPSTPAGGGDKKSGAPSGKASPASGVVKRIVSAPTGDSKDVALWGAAAAAVAGTAVTAVVLKRRKEDR